MPVVTREELEASLSELCTRVRDPRAGILGPDSLAWRLGGDLAVFIGGGRAALLQLAHPMVAHAIDHHSKTRTDVVGRFQRTFRNVFAMVFGELDDALHAARRVYAVHNRITGEITHGSPRLPAGTRYYANDADALRWVHATLVDTTIVVRERLDGALPLSTKDRYIVELNRFAALFGIPKSLLANTWTEHADYMRSMIDGDTLAVSPHAREMGQFLFGRGLPNDQPSLGRVGEAVSATLLPPHISRAFELRASPLPVRAGLAAFRTLYHQLPARVVALPARSEAERRLVGQPPSRFSAWTERQLFGLAHRATGQ